MNDRHLLENELDSLLAHADLDLPSDQAEHLAECSDCQKRMEQLAAENADWDSAKENLASSFDPLASIDFLVVEPRLWGHVAGEAFTESMAIQLLQPPSHPEMLGRLGRYEVERLIGSGGMGIVFKAFDTELHRPVAIKSLAPFLAGSGSARHRFAREARAAAAVVHDHVVPIHNVETDHSVPYLVMQYIAGDSLQTRLDREGTIELAEILRIGMQVASGLAAAHSQGLIHRDVKPSNILLDENVSRALLTDFGLARTQDDACLTRSGFQPGTPSYMSPEQVRGEDLDGRSDLFGLGCVLYALCTGHPPFRAESGYAILRRITDETPRSICEQNPSIPAWFERIVMKLLEKDRTARYQSATDLSQDLEQCLAHVQKPTIATLPTWMTMIPSRIAGAGSNRSRIGKWLIGGFASLALFFAGVLIVLESNKCTLTIKSEADSVPIRIKQSDKVIEELIVNRTGKTLRVFAGEYIVELDGDSLDLVIEGNEVRLNRGESKSIQIAYSRPAVTSVEPFDQRNPEGYTGAPLGMGPGGTCFDLELAKKTERLAQDALDSAKAKNQAGTASLAEVAAAQKALGLAKQTLVDALGNRPGEVADPLDVKSLTNCLIEHEKICHQLLDAEKIDYQSGLNDIDTLASAQRSLLDSRLSLIKHLLGKHPVERQLVLDLMNSSIKLWREYETSLAATLVNQKEMLIAGFTDADSVATAEKALEMTRIFLKQEFDELRKELKDRGVKYDIKSLGSTSIQNSDSSPQTLTVDNPEQLVILNTNNVERHSESLSSPKFLNSTTDVEQHVKRLLQDRKNLDHFYVDFKLTGKSVNGGESYSSRYRVWHHDGDWRGDSTMAHPLANRVQLDTSRHCYFLDRLSKKTLFQEGRNRPSLGSIPDFRRVGLIPWSTESLDQFPFENALLHEHHGPLQLRDSEVKGLFKYSYHRNKPEPKLESSTVEVWLDSAHDNYPAKIVSTWIDKDGAGNGRMELNTQWKWDGESWYPAVTDHHYRSEYNGQVSESSEQLEVVRWKRFKPNEFPVEVFEPENCLKDHE